MATRPAVFVDDYHYERWEPVWTACQRNMVVVCPIGTDPMDLILGGYRAWCSGAEPPASRQAA